MLRFHVTESASANLVGETPQMAGQVTVEIRDADGVFFSLSSENVFTPTVEFEREVVFRALANALAFMAGLNEQCSMVSTIERVAKSAEESERDAATHSPGVVVPLRARQSNEIQQSLDIAFVQLPPNRC